MIANITNVLIRIFSQAFPRFQAMALLASVACASWGFAEARADVLLNEKWEDGSRVESKRPKQSAVWIGRKADVTVKPGLLSTKLTPASQKIWTYFTDKEPVSLKVGEKLLASVSFIPREKLNETTSRSVRIGVFHDSTSPRVEQDLNSDAGGPDMPWTDATGYAVQVLVSGGEYTTTKPFDLGKRANLKSPSLLGTSGDFMKVSGGEPVTLELDKEYTVTLEIDRVSAKENEITVRYSQGEEELSAFTVYDDGDYLGTSPVNEKFDMLFVRIANNTTTADKIDFTNFKVELVSKDGAKQSEATVGQ